jgi:hypothetical protein
METLIKKPGVPLLTKPLNPIGSRGRDLLRIRLSDARTCTQHKHEASGFHSIGSGIRQLANTQGVAEV